MVGFVPTPATDGAGAPPLVLYQVRDLASVLHREADALRDAVSRLNAFALTVRWQSNSARACLDELADMARQMTAYAGAHDELALSILAHADQAEAAAAAAVGTLPTPLVLR